MVKKLLIIIIIIMFSGVCSAKSPWNSVSKERVFLVSPSGEMIEIPLEKLSAEERQDIIEYMKNRKEITEKEKAIRYEISKK